MTSSLAPTVGIIGAGRVAWSLGPGLARAGYRLDAVAAREAASAEALAAACGSTTRATTLEVVLDVAEVVFLAIPDSAVTALAAALPWRAGHAAVHCSGALGLDVLAPAVEAGARAGCLHPLQSFPTRRAEPERFTGVTCGVEGTGDLGGVLERMVAALGARAIRLEGVDRAAYHAAAVFASNDVVALMAAARRTWALAGLPPETARDALAPLLNAVAGNLAHLDPEDALTGPIARGDIATVEAHLAALASMPELRALYSALAVELIEVAPNLDAATAEALRRALRAG